MQAIVDPKLSKHTTIISPGLVGSVGDVNMARRLAQSSPDMPMRYADLSREPFYGSNVQDGNSKSFESHGMGATVVDKKWSGGRSAKTNHGWRYQDVRVPDRRVEPLNIGTPGYDWYNQIATIYKAKVSGDQFLPLPGEYQLDPNEVPRGGAVPRIVGTEFGNSSSLLTTPVITGPVTTPVVARPPTSGQFTPSLMGSSVASRPPLSPIYDTGIPDWAYRY